MFLLRGGGLAALELRDVSVSISDGAEYVRICIRKSRTDKEVGALRSLETTKLALFPVTRMGNWLGEMEVLHRASKLFGGDVLELVTRLIKWIVAQYGMPSGRFPIRSLRDGRLFASFWGRLGVY